MQVGYFKTAWNDIKATPGWVGKMFLMALIACIPIFGLIVVLGYLYGWSRDAAWGVKGPMPKRIFGNEDGKLYSRGFFILVLGIVLAVIPATVYSIGLFFVSTATSSIFYGGQGFSHNPFAFLGVFGSVFSLVYMTLIFAALFFQGVGAMRISIYGQLSAGFQLKKIWAMIRKDFVGLLKIFAMTLLMGLIVGIITTFLFVLVLGALFVVAFSGLLSSGAFAHGAHLSGIALAALLEFSAIAILLSFGLAYLLLVPALWISTLSVRALGYWTRQFDVPAWRGQEDPMPFELLQAAQRPPAGSPPPY